MAESPSTFDSKISIIIFLESNVDGTFARLTADGKITNQGNSTGESSEGVWFNYSDVKDSLTELHTNEELSAFAYLATAGLAAHV